MTREFAKMSLYTDRKDVIIDQIFDHFEAKLKSLEQYCIEEIQAHSGKDACGIVIKILTDENAQLKERNAYLEKQLDAHYQE